MTANSQTETLVLDYDLLTLPTAQHKAGLAGLLVMIESMKRRRLESRPKIDHLDAVSAKLSFTKEAFQALFDDLYGAAWVETKSKTKWKKQEPKSTVEVEVNTPEGKTKTEKRYLYDVVQPSGDFLASLYPDGDGIWLKLWRDMLWSVLRGIPKTRTVYEERASGNRSSLGESLWKDLKKSQQDELKGKVLTKPISSSIFIGAQDVNAEKIPFKGQVEHNLLLHFWALAALTYVPQVFSIDGESDFKGYVLVVPEPSDLGFFWEDVIELMTRLETETAGYRPKASVISIPEEGGLEYLYHLARHRTAEQEMASSLTAIEIYHLEKRGNSIRTLAAERILQQSSTLQNYEVVRRACRNPLYKSARIRSLLLEEPWHTNMEALFSQHPLEFFVYSKERTPAKIPFFGLDVRKAFSALEEDLKLKQGGPAMVEAKNEDDLLAQRTYRLIRQYVNRRTEEKSGKKWEDFKNHKNDKGQVIYPAEYREARQKVCSDAFLAMRGRREQDFVEYFTGTICSVPQFLPEDDYLAVTRALIQDPERVKVFAMLALSAHSYLLES